MPALQCAWQKTWFQIDRALENESLSSVLMPQATEEERRKCVQVGTMMAKAGG